MMHTRPSPSTLARWPTRGNFPENYAKQTQQHPTQWMNLQATTKRRDVHKRCSPSFGHGRGAAYHRHHGIKQPGKKNVLPHVCYRTSSRTRLTSMCCARNVEPTGRFSRLLLVGTGNSQRADMRHQSSAKVSTPTTPRTAVQGLSANQISGKSRPYRP